MEMISAHDRHAARAAGPAGLGSATPVRTLLIGAAIAAAVAGLLVGRLTAGHAGIDPELARLLRMMVVLKAMLAAAATALVAWRLGLPAGRGVALGCVVAASLMAGGTALMWDLTLIVPGGLVFHAGLALLALLGWRDGMGRRRTGR